ARAQPRLRGAPSQHPGLRSRPGGPGRSGALPGQAAQARRRLTEPPMAVKRKPRRSDPQRSLRDHLVELLDGGHAHVTFDDAIADWPPGLRSTQPAGQPFTPWRVLEHIRISQWDIVEFTKSAKHVSPERPAGYWPAGDAPPDPGAWDKSVAQGKLSLQAGRQLVP